MGSQSFGHDQATKAAIDNEDVRRCSGFLCVLFYCVNLSTVAVRGSPRSTHPIAPGLPQCQPGTFIFYVRTDGIFQNEIFFFNKLLVKIRYSGLEKRFFFFNWA